MTKSEATAGRTVVHTFPVGGGGWGAGEVVDTCRRDERVVRVRFAEGVRTCFVRNLAAA